MQDHKLRVTPAMAWMEAGMVTSSLASLEWIPGISFASLDFMQTGNASIRR
jgi:hypothetical protein|tara:strand:- start:2020 stop:2172 length:153 start_codon:yes stop_codon:yes gene_type:complete